MNDARLLRIVLGLRLAVAGLTQVLATRDALRDAPSGEGKSRVPVVLGARNCGLVAARE